MTPPRRPLRTARLRLEPVALRHTQGLHAAVEASRAELRPWMRFADQDFDASLEFVRGAERGWRRDQEFNFAVVEDGSPIGNMGLQRARIGNAAELGYWIRSDRSGRGYTTEGAAALVDFGFDTLGLERLEVVAGTGNLASLRVIAKLGFRFEGHARARAVDGGGRLYDCYAFALLRTDERGVQRGAAGEGAAEESESPSSQEPGGLPDFSHGLVTAVAQDQADGTVLMVAHMDEEAFRRTQETRRACFWSRSRQQLWEKGATSGNFLTVHSITVDCDGDTVLLRVEPAGPACHTGNRSCFHNPVA